MKIKISKKVLILTLMGTKEGKINAVEKIEENTKETKRETLENIWI